jgi:hypothetical protein
VVLHDNYQICVDAPDLPETHGHMCGLSGDMDGNPDNDLKLKNGTITDNAHENAFGDSWITSSTDQCFTGSDMNPGTCTPAEHLQARLNCELIHNATGSLAACQAMNSSEIEQYFDGCVYDQCAFKLNKSALCIDIEAFVTKCQAELPGTIVHWRSDGFCPLICPSHSHYDSCATGCPATCGNQNAADNCTQQCTEGCSCDYGYVLDGDNTCVATTMCGCRDQSGYHPAGSTWVNDDCSFSYTCTNGTISSSPKHCVDNAECNVQNGNRDCYCKPGYLGDGNSNCTALVDPCASNPCQNGGSCIPNGQGYR